MLSDVLSDAVDEIKRYQDSMSDTYNENKKRIDYTVQVMENLRALYDTPPTYEINLPFPEVENQIENFLKNNNIHSDVWHYFKKKIDYIKRNNTECNSSNIGENDFIDLLENSEKSETLYSYGFIVTSKKRETIAVLGWTDDVISKLDDSIVGYRTYLHDSESHNTNPHMHIYIVLRNKPKEDNIDFILNSNKKTVIIKQFELKYIESEET